VRDRLTSPTTRRDAERTRDPLRVLAAASLLGFAVALAAAAAPAIPASATGASAPGAPSTASGADARAASGARPGADVLRFAAVSERADLAAPAGSRVSGTITGTAGPVADAVVTACPVSMAPQKGVPVECKGAATSAPGGYTITGLAPGSYLIRAAPPATAGTAAAAGYRGRSGYAAARSAATPLAVSGDATGIDLALPAGLVISGTVSGAGGRPATDAFVEACAADAPAGVACTGTYAGADGSFTIGGLGAGTFAVDVSAPRSSGLAGGYLGADGLTPLRSGARSVAAGASGIAIALPLARRLVGTVSLEGAGAAGANQVLVQACPDDSCVVGPSGWTRDDGTFEVQGLLPGTYTVSLSIPRKASHVSGFLGDGGYVPSRASAARVTVGGTDVRGLDVVLPRAAATLTGAATGGGVGLRAGVIVACGAGGTCMFTRTAPDGSYALALPSAGPWTVGLRAPALYSAGLPGAYTAGIVLPHDSPAADGYLGAGGFTPSASEARAVVVGAPDRTRPVVTSRSPAAGATKVSRSAAVVVRFSEPVTGVSARSMVLRDAATKKAIAATVTYDAVTRKTTLRPKTALPAGRRLTVTLAATIVDYSGNRLAPTSWTFTTKR
jgi:hypothetical protein